jgi:cytochrome c oxidase assembly protein subunit 15
LAFAVILLGAYTRLTDAGLSCPDWPHCYGYLTAPHTTTQLQNAAQLYPQLPVNIKKAWTEMTHRYIAGVEGILILILSFTLLFSQKIKKHNLKRFGFLLIVLLFTQVALGMLTVTEKLKPVIVLAHLLTGLSLLSILWWVYLNLHGNRAPATRSTPSSRVRLWAGLAFILAAIQVALGGWVSSHYAGLACIDFPFCNGEWLPSLQWHDLNHNLITIHMLHRIGAIITTGFLLAFIAYLLTKHTYRLIAIVLFSLLALQVTLGIMNILWLRPIWIALAHQGTGALLMLTILTILAKATVEHRHARQYSSLSHSL